LNYFWLKYLLGMYMKSKFPNVALSYIISFDLDSYQFGPDMRKGSINKLVLVY
jgi:hypothetical protein